LHPLGCSLERSCCDVVCQMMSKRTLVTLGVVDESTLGTVDSFTRTFHVPFVTTSVPLWNVSTRLAGSYTLYLRPSYDEAFLSVVRHYNWKHILYVYDTDTGALTTLCMSAHLTYFSYTAYGFLSQILRSWRLIGFFNMRCGELAFFGQ